MLDTDDGDEEVIAAFSEWIHVTFTNTEPYEENYDKGGGFPAEIPVETIHGWISG